MGGKGRIGRMGRKGGKGRMGRTVVVVWAVLAAVVSAAEVWDTKPFTQWSDKDVNKLLTDSPWAGKATLTHAREGGSNGPVPDWKLIVSLRSALPIRQALARRALGPGAALPPEAEGALAAPASRYIFAIAGIPRLYQPQLAKSVQAARLKMKEKAPIAATDASVFLIDKEGKSVPAPAPTRGLLTAPGVQVVQVAQRGGGGVGGGGAGGFGGFPGSFGDTDKSGITAMLVVEFPKTDALRNDDGKIELSTVIGAYKVEKEFKLKDMVFMGELAF
jgi:hypothetical protein